MIDWDPSPLPGFLGATGILWGRSGQSDLDILFPTNPKVDHLSWLRIREFPNEIPLLQRYKMIWNYIVVVCPFLWSVVLVDFALQAPQISSPTSQEVVFCLRKNYQRGVSRVICDLTWFIYIYLLFLFQRFFLPQDPHIHQLKHLILLPFFGPQKVNGSMWFLSFIHQVYTIIR